MARTQVAIGTTKDSNGSYNIFVCDVTTGNIITTYKPQGVQTPVPKHCIDVIGDHYLICSYQNSPILNVWSLDRKDRLHRKMILPSSVTALSVSLDGEYCIAALGPKVHIWQICTGYLLNVLDKHYQTVTCIKIASDLSYFITGGDDGMVFIWSFAKLVVPSEIFSVIDGQSDRFDPIKRITNSSTKINDIYMTEGGIRSRFVVSAHQNVKIYELLSGQLLAVISFKCPIESVVMDRKELFLFCGGTNGEIFECRLSNYFSTYDKSATEGDKTKFIDLNSIENNDSNTTLTPIFRGHTSVVTSLAVSIDGHALLSGSQDHSLKVWHIESRQCMKTINVHGALTNLIVFPALSSLFLFDQLSNNLNLETINNVLLTTSAPSTSKQTISRIGDQCSNNVDQQDIAIANPPVPVSVFKRELLSLETVKICEDENTSNENTNDEDTGLSPFEREAVSIRNGIHCATDLWPWSANLMPTESDIESIFEHKGTFFDECFDDTDNKMNNQIGAKNTANSIHTNGMAIEIDGAQDNLNDDDDHELNENRDLHTKLEKLKLINQQLYNYSVDKIFSDLF